MRDFLQLLRKTKHFGAVVLVFGPKSLYARINNRLRGNLPVPPPRLIALVAGGRSAWWFLKQGSDANKKLRKILRRNGVRIKERTAILDFGCGVGRVMRYWTDLRDTKLYGSDYNPKLIAWSQKHLPFAEFSVNTLQPKLQYDDRTFDLIYLFSVFTHLVERDQKGWLRAFSRALKPGGYLFITTMGRRYLDDMTPEQRREFANGKLVVRNVEVNGENACGAFHPEQYVRKEWGKLFKVVDFVEGGGPGDRQDCWLLQRR
jgi:2-polyprenyl-3-methyl-5-hydroxy-6-metoxy-1,4-benzoquinol methylase